MNNKLLILMIVSFFIFISCKKKRIEFQPTLEQLEREIRNSKDGSAVLSYNQYRILLSALKEKQSIILPLYNFKDYFDNSKIIVGMRHDVDRHPFKALEMAEIENDYNINSSYYLLPTDRYYGYLDDDNKFIHIKCMNNIYKKIYHLGNEIGMHNDLLTVMILWGLDPKEFNYKELLYLDSIGIKLYGTTSHGSEIARDTKTGNYEIFKEFNRKDSVCYEGKKYPLGIDSLKQFGFEYEGNFIEHNKFIHDVGGKWTYTEYLSDNKKNMCDFWDLNELPDKNTDSYIRRNDISFEEVINIINELEPGDRIILLTHPVWWGK